MNQRLKSLTISTLVSLLALPSAFAQTPGEAPAKPLAHALVNSLIFAFIGMGAVLVAVFLFDRLTPKISIQAELLKNNTAVAIVTAAVVIGVSIIVAASIM